MPYKKTQERIDYETWHKKAIVIARKSCSRYCKQEQLSDYLLCSAVFLIHARFENYIKDIVRLITNSISTSNINAGKLPGRLRICNILNNLPHAELRHYYVFNNERQCIDKLHEVVDNYDWRWTDKMHLGHVDDTVVIGSDGYPTVANIKKIFYRIGISNIVAEINKRMHADSESIIEDIGEIRCEMAHVGMPQNINHTDVINKIKSLNNVVNAIDRIAITLVSKL